VSGPGSSCDPGLVFELVDGSLDGEEARAVREHLRGCPDCRGLYERERALNASLRCMGARRAEPEASQARSVHRAVAMALPTRGLLMRLLWAVLALVLLASAVVLAADGVAGGVMAVVGLLSAVRGLVWSAVEVAEALRKVAGPVLIAALVVGAVVDLALACAIFLARRARARQRPGRA
jgi:anti-sigma factor RsiW